MYSISLPSINDEDAGLDSFLTRVFSTPCCDRLNMVIGANGTGESFGFVA